MASSAAVRVGLFATVGSTNFDNRSFQYNYELDLAVHDEGVARHLAQMFVQDIGRSRPYTYEQWANRSVFKRLTEWALVPIRSQL